ncbi:diaminopimelate epimerase [Panacagrimonas perspica]|uniref:Diaminopimelate epimerase n=1 Tax=Panacagrimonas perspica TaxID=381431 RepID=A0A4R7NYZ3_9GAMM|nr:diaminopimelate epimerase [Panacagrimonas perspica]THD02085.1 diaminopimelate epimerase [Panacagrimonas perspica]
MQLRFTKMHGTGNDFVVIDATRARFAPTPALLHRLTDRRFGVGCDQVLVVEAPSVPDVDFDYRIFNADGSEVGQCGNGSRCLARFVADQGLSDKPRLRVRTRTSILELQRRDDGQVTVDMGAPRFEPRDIPFKAAERRARYALDMDGQRIEFGAVSMGNPHLVMEVADVDTAPVGTLGPKLEPHPDFPERVNVGFLQIVSRDRVRLRVFERGAGETLACGSGACAAVAVGQLWGRLDPRVIVQVRGGELIIESKGEGEPVLMTGPAQTVFTGELEWNE